MPLIDSANLILMGLRGSGKSTLGRELGGRLARGFVDLDDVTLRSLGHATASGAFREAGEMAFRAAEAAGLSRVLRGAGQVVALGGGTPTAPGAADLLRRARDAGQAWIVYLHGTPEVLRRRLAGTDMGNRPGLLGGDPLSEIGAVYARRDGLYRSLADVVLEVDARPADETAGAIERAWKSEPRE